MERTRAGFHNIARDAAKETAKNFLMGFDRVRAWRLKRPRAGAFFTGADSELNRYAFSGLNLLREYVGGVEGKTVCEIGAGDYLTSGLAILAAHARSYAVIDRFPGDYYGETAKNWYRAIEENWSKFYPEIEWRADLRAEDFPERYDDLIEIIREPIETANPANRYDIVCSFQVGEHVSDISAYAEIHNRILGENGVGLHRVDFGPHDCWHLYSDPLTFLRFPDWLWRATGSNRGTPNRRRHHEFMQAFERANLNVEIALIDHFDEKTINFERLDKQFQKMPRESVLVGTAIYKLSRRK